MGNSKPLISLVVIIPLILPMLSGLAISMPRSISPSIGGFPVEVNHENVIVELKESLPSNSQEKELYSSHDIIRISHLGFPKTDPIVRQTTYTYTSLSKNSLLSTMKPWMWIRNQTDQICEDINTANATVLQRVKGIGRVKAEAIIDYRNQHGPFQSLDELTQVKGIGPTTVENFRTAGFCVQGANSTAEIQSSQPNSAVNDSIANSNNCDNINTANATDLQRVNRIGAVKAQAIVAYRGQHGPFQSLDQLTRIRGIGPATIENFREAGFCVPTSTETSNPPSTPTQASPNNSTTTDNNCNNINTANAVDLQRINRIGVVKAQSIIDYRNQHGPFRSLDELTRVRGIGPATLENFRRAGFCAPTSTSGNASPDGPLYSTSNDPTASDNICKDINTANAATLQRTYGIDPVGAKAIIDYRNQHGPFMSLNALHDIKEIEPAKFDNFQESVFCSDTFSAVADSVIHLSNPPGTPSIHTSPLPYRRSLYGGWLDTDNDCQNTRHEILIAESRVEATLDGTGCIVIAGEWYDPYLDSLITDPSVIDIDHFIPLAEVHRSGGAKWDDSTRYSFGNDLSENGVLIPVSASVNRSKGQRDPAGWLPPNASYHCQYVDRWAALKETWRLTMDYAERKAVMDIQGNCRSDSEAP